MSWSDFTDALCLALMLAGAAFVCFVWWDGEGRKVRRERRGFEVGKGREDE